MRLRSGRRHRAWRWLARLPATFWRWVTAALTTVWRGLARATGTVSAQVRRAAVLGNLVPADIILARPRTLSLSPIAFAYRFLLRADYVHSMLYIGRGKVLHTTSRHGVVVVPTPRTIYKRDRYAVLRHPSLTDGDRARVVDNAMQLHGMRLDYPALVTNVPARLAGLRKPLVRLEANRVWCSRLIVRAYADAGVDIVPPDQVEHVTSEDLVRSPLLVRL